VVQVLDFLFQRTLQFVGRAAQFAQTLAKCPRDLREFLGPKQQESNKEYEPDFGKSATEQGQPLP
jgi:hypothetical protein